MKKTFALSILAFTISSQSFALEKNIDFYNNGHTSKSIISYEGKLSEFNNIKFEDNILYIDNIKKESFIRLNDKTGYLYSYSLNNSMYDILKNHIGENVSFNNSDGYKIFRVEEPYVILEKGNNFQYVNELKEFKIPGDWLNLTNGYKITFKEKIKEIDNIFYSYDEESLQSMNKYEIILISDKSLLLTHFIDIENNGKPHKDVNISFFHGDMNIKDSTVRFYKNNRAESLMSSDMVAGNNFTDTSLSNIKVVELKNTHLNSGSNKFNYKEKQFEYNEYVKLNNDYIINNPIHKDVKLSDLKEQINFSNYISFELKEDILPQGEVKVYEKNKLIISDNISYSEKEPVFILKNSNKDLKIENIEFTYIEKEVKNIKSIEILNTSNRQYKLKFNEKVYILEPNKKTNLTLI